MKKCTHLNINTNILFFINGLLYLDIPHYLCAFSLTLWGVASFMYHYKEETEEFWKTCLIIASTNALFISFFYALMVANWWDVFRLLLLVFGGVIAKYLAIDSYKNYWIWNVWSFITQCYLCHLIK